MRYLKVLIIDDEPALRQILGNAVSKAGHSVKLAENGTKALEKLSSEQFDVALCDIRMPDMTGIQVVSKAREAGTPDGPYLEAFPNPFRNTTTIRFRLPVEDEVVLEVYSLSGILVKKVFEGNAKGEEIMSFEFSGEDRPAGVYFIRLRMKDGKELNAKLLLIR